MKPPFDATEPHEVEQFDLVWARLDDDTELEATVYRPAGATEGDGYPCLLDVHGGAWTYFDRRVDFNYDRRLAACGMVVLSVDFRLAPAHPYPAAVVDVNAATRWLESHAAELGGDAERIGFLGGSSGGHLALLSALCPTRPEYLSLAGHKGTGTTLLGGRSAAVDYVIALWPITDPLRRYEYLHTLNPDDRMVRTLIAAHHGFYGEGEAGVSAMIEASPERIVESGSAAALPPVLIQFPELDQQVTLEMQEAFAKVYEAAGGSVELEVLPGMAHSPANLPGPDGDYCIEIMKRFVAGQLGGQ